jgi:hypothetical protein
MTDETYISEAAALRILRQKGDFTDNQARIVLLHSKRKEVGGAPYYPTRYIYKRARDRAARPD